MLCPYCGHLDHTIDTPEKTKVSMVLGDCKKCDKKVYSIPSRKRSEKSQISTVIKGEEREEFLSKLYLNHEGGTLARKRSRDSDIDREVLNSKNEVIYYLEIKERSNSLNAYKITMFPYAKINEAQELIKTHNLPVFIVLKFLDCWARIKVDVNKNYDKGDEPFAPRYRPWQRIKERQKPVLIDINSLEILKFRDECEENIERFL